MKLINETYEDAIKRWGITGSLVPSLLKIMEQAEGRRQGAAFRVYSRDGKVASRIEAKFLDAPLSDEEARRRGFQFILFPDTVWKGSDA